MIFLHLLYQIPAIFTACAALYYVLPFKLHARLLPLYMVVVSFFVMMLPVHYCLALGVAGLVTLLHKWFGVRFAQEEAPDVKGLWDKGVSAYGWLLSKIPERLQWPGRQTTYVHDDAEHDDPPHPPETVAKSRIPPLPG